MLFKQLKIYQLPKNFKLNADKLTKKLSPLSFKQCLPSLPFSYGWVTPHTDDKLPLVYELEKCLLFSIKIEEKLLPGIVINQELASQVKEIEAQREGKLSAKEKKALKDQVTQTLLPRAFSKYSDVHAYFDFKNNWLIVNTSSTTKLDKFNELLKRTLPDLKLTQLNNKQLIYMLTNWIHKNKMPANLHINRKLVLKDPNHKQHVARLDHEELEVLPLENLFKQGFRVFQLGLSLADQLDFVINDDNTITGVKFSDEVKSDLKGQYGESDLTRLNADFYLQIESFANVINLIFSEANDVQAKSAELETA